MICEGKNSEYIWDTGNIWLKMTKGEEFFVTVIIEF